MDFIISNTSASLKSRRDYISTNPSLITAFLSATLFSPHTVKQWVMPAKPSFTPAILAPGLPVPYPLGDQSWGPDGTRLPSFIRTRRPSWSYSYARLQVRYKPTPYKVQIALFRFLLKLGLLTTLLTPYLVQQACLIWRPGTYESE